MGGAIGFIVVLFVSGRGFLFHVNSTILGILRLSCRRASRVEMPSLSSLSRC